MYDSFYFDFLFGNDRLLFEDVVDRLDLLSHFS